MTGAPDERSLAERAGDGDAAAQYALAAKLARAGRREEAERWLQSAAESGCADAIFTLATRKMNSLDKTPAAVVELERAASGGSNAARRLIAVLDAAGYGVPQDDKKALSNVMTLARGGEPAAMREIAALLALADPDDPDIGPLIAVAAPHDPVAAAFCLARAARAAGDEASLAASASLLKRLRYPRLVALAARAKRGAGPAPTPDWNGVASRADLSASPRLVPERLSASPDIVVYRGAIAPEICEYVIASSTPHLGPSLVYDPVGDRMIRDPLRTSATASLAPIDLDLALVALNRVMAAAAALPQENGEFLSVLRYLPGQLYRPHLDCIPPGADFDRSGQRIKTALLFLNEDFGGGETHFLANDLKFRGKAGDILVFANVDAAGVPDPAARHAGLGVASGEKWLASKWFRSKKFLY
jgi:hypothetical protein